MEKFCLTRISTNKEFYFPNDAVVASVDFSVVNLTPAEVLESQGFKRTSLCDLYQKNLSICENEDKDSCYYTINQTISKEELKVNGFVVLVYGVISCNPSWITFPKSETIFLPTVPKKKNTYLIFSSKPKNILCGRIIKPKRLFNISFDFTLPDEKYLPPTYHGKVLNIKYYLSFEFEISDHKSKSKTQPIRIPLNISTPSASFRKIFPPNCVIPIKWNFSKSDEMIDNKYLDNYSLVDFLENIQTKKYELGKRSNFLIKYNNTLLVTLIVSSLYFSLGEDIVCTFSFEEVNSPEKIVVEKVIAKLVCKENVIEKLLKIDTKSFDEISANELVTISKNVENVNKCGMVLTIPSMSSNATQSFKTGFFDVDWEVRFTFCLKIFGTNNTQRTEEMNWNLPLHVYAEINRDGKITHKKKSVFTLI